MTRSITTITFTIFCFFFIAAQNEESRSLSDVTPISIKVMKHESGIEVSYSKEKLGDNILLNIHFKNTSSLTKNISWIILKSNGLMFNSAESFDLEAGTEYVQKYALELKDQERFEDYPISLTIK